MKTIEESKAEFIGDIRGAIIEFTAGEELGKDQQTKFFVAKLLWLLNEYQHNTLEG